MNMKFGTVMNIATIIVQLMAVLTLSSPVHRAMGWAIFVGTIFVIASTEILRRKNAKQDLS